MKWKMKMEGKEHVRECRLVNEPMNSIAFIRAGTIGLSKSALINSIISPTEKTHPIFFHRDSPGSTQHRYLVNGLVDISWYFPSPESGTTVSNHFQEAVVFLNLHGDASKLQNHLKMLSNLANVVTILCTVNDLVLSGDIAKLCLDQGKAVLIVLTNHTIREDEEGIIESFIERHKVGQNRLELMEVIDKQRADVVQEIRNILIKLSNGKLFSFNDIFKSDIYPDVDEKTDEFTRTMRKANTFLNLVSKTLYTERKSLFFSLQGDPWIKCANADKENPINKKNMTDSHTELHKEQNKRLLTEYRCKLLETLKLEENRTFMVTLLNSINKSQRTRSLFLRWLHFEMDDLSKKDLGPIYENYHKIMEGLAHADYQDREKLKTKLKDLDHEVELRSFGLDHVLEEMGQMHLASHISMFDLPELAAEILLDGYPFKLMDEYVKKDRLKWVLTVLNKVEHILSTRDGKHVRIKVFAALGLHSSGTSTMLNALFGCQYAVSSGRCTRGVYCQFVKVEERYRQELEFDYIMAIDTDGLRVSDLSASGPMVQHHTELSSFVIGLADLIILNFIGESVMYLEKLIPTSVQKFLRVNISTDLRLKKCLIVHQNVNKEDKQKLLSQGRALDEMLDEMTKLAYKDKIDTKSFQDIISFDVSTDVIYLPSQHEGSSPMSPISIRYSTELNVLKQTMLTSTKDSASKTLKSFCDLLQSLWLAIVEHDFDVQHRDASEIEDKTKLDSCSGACDEVSKSNLSKCFYGQNSRENEKMNTLIANMFKFKLIRADAKTIYGHFSSNYPRQSKPTENKDDKQKRESTKVEQNKRSGSNNKSEETSYVILQNPFYIW